MMLIPILTEKSSRILEQGQYTFDCPPHLTKIELRKMIEETFNVKVTGINSHRPPRRKKRLGQYQGVQSQIKRVIFTLRPGDNIPLFE